MYRNPLSRSYVIISLLLINSLIFGASQEEMDLAEQTAMPIEEVTETIRQQEQPIFGASQEEMDLTEQQTATNIPQETSGARYLFHQQLNDMCMIAPMVNLKLLEKMQNPDGTYTFPEENYFTRRQWFIKNMTPLVLWHKGFNTYTIHTDPTLAPLKKYLDNAIKDGPSFPSFYRQNGSSYISLKAADLLKTNLETPYFFIDMSAMQKTKFTILSIPWISGDDLIPGSGLFVPLVQENNQLKAGVEYDASHILFENIELEPTESYPYANRYDLENNNNLTDAKYNKLTYFDHAYLYRKKNPMLGFENVAITFDVALGYNKSNSSDIAEQYYRSPQEVQPEEPIYENYFPYLMGLYKLMLIRLGITNTPSYFDDLAQKTREQNIKQTIVQDETKPPTQEEQNRIQQKMRRINALITQKETENSQLAMQASQNIQTIVNANQNNPWSDSHFSQDNFFEHQLALILKSDRKLFALLSKTVDFYFTGWSTYKQFLKDMAQQKIFKDKQGREPYEYHNAKYYLPDEEHALAYCTVFILRGLWYGALSKKAFEESSETTSRFARAATGLYWDTLKAKANERHVYPDLDDRGLSFLDVWREIAWKFKTEKARKNWISFAGHGLVLSFDDQLIQLQKDTPGVEDQDLLAQLGFTIIESWLSTELPTFYKK